MAGPIPPLQTTRKRFTNKGIPLTSEWLGGESDTIREIPPEWRAALDLVATEVPVPTDEPLFQLSDEVLACKAEQKETSGRTMRTVRKPPGEFTLLEKFTNKDKEFGLRTRTFHYDTDFPGSLSLPSATKDVNTKNFGNKHFEEIVEEIPGVFSHQLYEEQINDPVPERFKALFPVSVEEHTEPDILAVDPTLGPGDLKKSEEQTDLFIVKKSHTFHDLSTLPQALTEIKLTPDQQIESILETLDTDPVVITPDALTQEYSVQQIAGGMYVSNVGTVPSVFPRHLFQIERQILWQLPPEFRSELPETTDRFEEAGTASLPSLVSGEIMASEEQVTEFKKRVETKTRDLSVLPLIRTSYKITKDKQIETEVSTLDTGLQTLSGLIDDLTVEASVQNLGDDLSLLKIGTVPSLFSRAEGENAIPDLVPREFGGILPIHTTSFDFAGSADTDPSLSDGQLSRKELQLDEFTFRRTIASRELTDLPAQLTSYKLTKDKQVSTVVGTLDLGLQTIPTVDELTTEADVKNLGGNLSLLTFGTVESLFDAKSTTIELPDLLPDIFKAALPSYRHEFVAAGTSVDDPPILDTGDFFKSETRETEFTGRVVTRGRAGISLPQDVVVLRKLTEEYGGETIKLTGYLDDSEPAVEEGLDVLTSEVRNLGNGTYFRQSEKLDTAIIWPALVGTEVDPRTGIAVGITKQVVDAGTTGGVAMDGSFVDVKSIDKWRSLSISSKLTAESLPDPVTWETTVEHRFPNTLLGIAWIWQAASAPFAYDFDMALVLDMLEGYAGPCRAKITESFSVGAPADTVTPTIFCPQGHMVGYTWGYAADPSEDCGTCIGIARANAKTWTIPPSLHDTIDLTGTVTLAHGSFTDTLPATCPVALPAAGTLITKACEVERWRFGVFYRKLTEIYVPDCSCV